MSAVTPPNYAETLRLIQTIRSLPLTGCTNGCGYTCGEIFEQYNILFPEFPLTLDEVCTLIRSGVRRGVFLHGGCASGETTAQICNPAVTATNLPENQLFFVNGAMAANNPHNAAYVAVGLIGTNNSTLITPRFGYMPCSAVFCSGGYGKAANPDGVSAACSTRFGTGGNRGTPTLGECIAVGAACGTCTF